MECDEAFVAEMVPCACHGDLVSVYGVGPWPPAAAAVGTRPPDTASFTPWPLAARSQQLAEMRARMGDEDTGTETLEELEQVTGWTQMRWRSWCR